MTAAPRERMTFKEYVAFEERSELRHEFYDGEVFAMAGAIYRGLVQPDGTIRVP
jgi:hypothetical protein